MIILDTNVISEMLRATPHPAVRTWLNEQAAESLYLSSITLAELLFGIAALPAGKRRNELAGKVEKTIELFDGRVLPFDGEAAAHYAELAARARKRGKGLPTPDGYIAAIAVSRDLMVACRDMAPFVAAGLRVINPWTAGSH